MFVLGLKTRGFFHTFLFFVNIALQRPIWMAYDRSEVALRSHEMTRNSTKIIVCNTIIKEMITLLPSEMEYQTVESGLHLRPEKLRTALQEFIDESPPHIETIILGYGLCSMAVVGLKSKHSTLVVPRLAPPVHPDKWRLALPAGSHTWSWRIAEYRGCVGALPQ